MKILNYDVEILNYAWFWACQRGEIGETMLNEDWAIDEIRAVFNKLWMVRV